MEVIGRTQDSNLILEVLNEDPECRIPAPDAVEETRGRLQQAFGASATVSWRVEEKRVVTELCMPLHVEAPA
jgi:hypothetical protein